MSVMEVADKCYTCHDPQLFLSYTNADICVHISAIHKL